MHGVVGGARQPFYKILYVQVLIAVVIGILLGHFWPQTGEAMKPLGDAFIKLIKMIIAPVIFLTVVAGIASMSDLEKVGRVGLKALLYFFAFSTLALIVGLIVANVVQPGAGLHIDPKSLDPKTVATFTAKAHESSILDFLMNIIPTTVVGAFSSGEILQVLLFAILFGFGLSFMGEEGKLSTATPRLHKELGEQKFIQFLRHYQKSFPWYPPSFNQDVPDLLKAVSGKDYQAWMDKYFYGTELPEWKP